MSATTHQRPELGTIRSVGERVSQPIDPWSLRLPLYSQAKNPRLRTSAKPSLPAGFPRLPRTGTSVSDVPELKR